MTSTSPPQDPLGPIDTIVSFLLFALGLLIVAAVALTVFGSGSLTYYGSNEACTVVDANRVPGGNSELRSNDPLGPSEYAEDSRVHADQISVCATSVGTGMHLLSVAGTMGGLLLLLVVLGSLRGLVRAARREGLFSTATATRTGQLGWALVLASVGLELLRQVVDHLIVIDVVRTPVEDQDWWWVVVGFDLPLNQIIAGIGLITLGRVLRHAVVLQNHEDATI